jgi:hypothetical protein
MLLPNEQCNGFENANKFNTGRSPSYKEMITSDGLLDHTVGFYPSLLIIVLARYPSLQATEIKVPLSVAK